MIDFAIVWSDDFLMHLTPTSTYVFFWFLKALYNAPPFGALRDDGWAAVTMGRFSRWGNPL